MTKIDRVRAAAQAARSKGPSKKTVDAPEPEETDEAPAVEDEDVSKKSKNKRK